MAIPLQEIEAANRRVNGFAHKTPVMTCDALDKISGKKLYFKCEHLQKVGAFKIRGAINAIGQLQETGKVNAVVTHSSGNHAQALALAGKLKGVDAHIIMPRTAPAVKRNAVEHTYKAKVYLSEPTQAAREALAEEVVAKTNGSFIHPYDNKFVQAGQGTCGYEFIHQVPDLDAVIIAIGGGGMMTGMGSAIKAINPKCRVFGAEPVMADDAFRSFRNKKRVEKHSPGKPNTIADGLLTIIADSTFDAISTVADDIITVTEPQIAYAMKLIMERMKQVIEPSAAVPLAALLSPSFPKDDSIKKVGIVLCGGNVDLSMMANFMKLAESGERARL